MHYPIMLSCLLIATVCGDSDDICLSLKRGKDQPHDIIRDGASFQPIPGKRGPAGPQGIKGEPGVPGQCTCAEDQLGELRRQIQQLQDANSYCSVGMRERRVRDEQITSSTEWDPMHGPTEARLDNQLTSGTGWGRGAWSARHNRLGEWIQVDLNRPTYLTKIITQGRPAVTDQWVTSYKLSYGNSTDQLQVIRDESGTEVVFQGNRDMDSYVINKFPQPVTARYVRLLPMTWHHHISLRLELLTC